MKPEDKFDDANVRPTSAAKVAAWDPASTPLPEVLTLFHDDGSLSDQQAVAALLEAVLGPEDPEVPAGPTRPSLSLPRVVERDEVEQALHVLAFCQANERNAQDGDPCIHRALGIAIEAVQGVLLGRDVICCELAAPNSEDWGRGGDDR